MGKPWKWVYDGVMTDAHRKLDKLAQKIYMKRTVEVDGNRFVVYDVSVEPNGDLFLHDKSKWVKIDKDKEIKVFDDKHAEFQKTIKQHGNDPNI